MPGKVWSEDEIKLLNDKFSIYRTTILRNRFFQDRTVAAITLQAARIGLRKDDKGAHRKYAYNKDFLLDWTPEYAYILGVIAADGNVMYKQGHYAITIQVKRNDHRWLEEIAPYFGEYPVRKYERSTNFSELYLYSSLIITCKELAKRVVEVGIGPNKSKTLKMPLMPKKYYSHFVRGYFDGDGCITRAIMSSGKEKKVISFSSGSCEFLEALSALIEPVYGSLMTPSKKKNGICQIGYTDSRRTAFLIDWMYQGATICLERKKNLCHV